jgi:hypothetical protein
VIVELIEIFIVIFLAGALIVGAGEIVQYLAGRGQ